MGVGKLGVSRNAVDQALAGPGHPMETEDGQEVALKSQKPTCCFRGPQFIPTYS